MQTPQVRWFYRPITVILALLLLGPFAFPLLWKSPCFGRFWKIFWTAVTILMTFYMIMGTWQIAEAIWKEFSQLAAV